MGLFERKSGEKTYIDPGEGLLGISSINADYALTVLSLIVFGLYLVRTIFTRTMFRGAWPDWYCEETLRGAAFVLMILRLAVTDLSKRLTEKQWLLVAFLEFVLAMCYASTEYGFTLDIGIYLILFIGVPARLILGIYCSVSVFVYLIGLIGAQSGAIPDLNYFTYNGDLFTIRRSLGTAYPTDCTAAWFYILLAFWLLSDKIPQIISIVLMLLASAGSYYLCNARNNTICLFIAAAGVLYHWLTEYHIRRIGKRNCLIRIVDCLMTAAFSLFAVITISLSWFYQDFSKLFSGISRIPGTASFVARFSLAHQAFETYGVTLFGSPFTMVGMGSSAVNNGVESGYNFVDCSYCMIFVRYGVMMLILFGVMYVLLCRRAIKEGWRKLLISLAVISLQSVTEHHYAQIYYNITLVLLFAGFDYMKPGGMTYRSGQRQQEKEINMSGLSKHRVGLLILYVAAIIAGVIVFTPRLLSYCRTLVTIGGFAGRSRRLLLIVFLGGMLCAILLFFVCIWLTLNSFKRCRQRKMYCLQAAGIVLSVLILTGGVLWVKRVFRIHYPEYQGLLEASSAAIESLGDGSKNNDFNIYVDDIPEYYRERYGSDIISDHFYTENGLCMEKDCVVITDSKQDLNLLIARGFLYGELSDEQGIYTNSEVAQQLLSKAGVDLSTDYITKHEVDLTSLAKKHEMELGNNGEFIIDGNKEESRAVWDEGNITVYSGLLEVEYNLKLVSSEVESGRVGKVLIRSVEYEEPYTVDILNREDFDPDGRCSITLQVSLPEDRGDLAFPVIADEGTVIEVEAITYRKIAPSA